MRKFVVGGMVVLFLAAALRVFALPDKPAEPFDLQCDALNHPLGDDNKQPLFSWKLQDARTGARQTAYRILVASSAKVLARGHADVWDSGRVASGQSVDVLYSGPSLRAGTRYYWRVQAWDAQGKPYPESEANWWETGLFGQEHWVAQWIGYEDQEQRGIREARAQWVTNPAPAIRPAQEATHHDFRLRFGVQAPIRRAVLYATGEDTTAAWVNGAQVMRASTQPAWGRTPWRTYVRQDVTEQVHAGTNVLAVEITRFEGRESRAPMNAMLYLVAADGSACILKTGMPDWKATLAAQGDWFKPDYDDSAWAAAVQFSQVQDAFGGKESLGIPLPTAAVAALRHDFSVTRRVTAARLYATALGAYQFRLNGKPVGDQVLAPGWTDFRQHVYYQTYDVTALLADGENVLSAYLAPGWYSTPLEWIGQGNNYGSTPNALKAQLKITYADGTSEWIATNGSWKANVSPIAKAEIYDGETYDARRLQAGWDRPGFSDASWSSAAVIQPHEPQITWQSFEPIRATETITPKSVTNPRPGVFIYDMGQNLAGVAKIRLRASAGTTVQLRFGELLNSDGTLYVANLRNAKATDRYTFATNGVEEYEPTFTFHGFRYVELSGIIEAPGLEAVRAVALHTDYPFTAKLKTGSAMINQLWSNILWGQRSNFVGVPTDCPQRDERLGWAADAQVFWRTASYNADLTTFSRKYAADLRGTQSGTWMYGIYAPGTGKENPGYGPGWSDVGVIVPWTSWLQNGDKTIIRQNWDGMEKYLETILSANPDYLWKNNRGINFGDWVAPEGPTSEVMIATAYWAYDVSLMRQMAHAIGRDEDKKMYGELFLKIKDAFIHTWVHPDGRVAAEPPEDRANPGDRHTETQTGYTLALHMQLLPDTMRAQAADRLVELIAQNGWKLGTGFLGTPYLLEVLSDTGHMDVAYRLLMNTEYPSWGYMVTHGATTMWERWNGDKMLNDPGMNSFNHYAYGAVGEWLYRYAAGIDATAADPGFHTVLLHPYMDSRLGTMALAYESRYGEIRSEWTAKGNRAEWKVTLPPNTRGRLLIPAHDVSKYNVDGRALSASPMVKKIDGDSNNSFYELAAGTYSILIEKGTAAFEPAAK